MQRRVPGADLEAGQGERAVPPDLVHRDADVVHDLRRGQRPNSAGPIGQSELSMSMICLARRPCGVLVSMWMLCAAPAGPAGPASAQPQARATTIVTATVIVVAQRRARLASGLGVGPRNVQHNLELQ